MSDKSAYGRKGKANSPWSKGPMVKTKENKQRHRQMKQFEQEPRRCPGCGNYACFDLNCRLQAPEL